MPFEIEYLQRKENIFSTVYFVFLWIFTSPFILMGYLYAIFLHFPSDIDIIYVFPTYHTGGAEKVHTDIVKCQKDRRQTIFFTYKSTNDRFLKVFSENTNVIDLKRFQRFYFLYQHLFVFFLLGYIANYVNRQNKPIFFGSNTIYYYLVLPYLRKNIVKIDLTHNFGGGLEYKNWRFIKYLDKRVIINRQTYQDLKEQYLKHRIPVTFLERIVLIPNSIILPSSKLLKPRQAGIKLIYVGRGDREKRVFLIGKIARICSNRSINAEFILIGNVAGSINDEDKKYCLLPGEISDKERDQYYRDSDLLILTSTYEGFPVVIMEAMAYGVVPLSTNVGGISEHISNGTNGILVLNNAESDIIQNMVTNIEILSENHNLLEKISKNAYQYAHSNFSMERFCKDYEKLFSI